MSEKISCGTCRKNTVGGQAVIEGVMMKSRDRYSVATRKEDGTIAVSNHPYKSVRAKVKILNLPIIRGAVNFIEMLILSYRTLSVSAQSLGLEGVEESRFEKWLREKFGKSIFDVIMVISVIFGFALALGLFTFLPILITKGINSLIGRELGWIKNLIEGLIKIAIFIVYLWAVSLTKDIRRTFEYHGAEHKSIFCYESGEELTVENARKCRRFHPRCGTSFIFVVLIISILLFSLPFVTWDNMFLRMATKLAMLPLVVGISYEFIMWAGKHDENPVSKVLSAPGLLMQRITTREPDDSQLEVAITALKNALPGEFGLDADAVETSEEKAEDVTAAETVPEDGPEEHKTGESAEKTDENDGQNS